MKHQHHLIHTGCHHQSEPYSTDKNSLPRWTLLNFTVDPRDSSWRVNRHEPTTFGTPSQRHRGRTDRARYLLHGVIILPLSQPIA